ncbi:MAG: hypothetical protein ACE5J7_03195 [Candidatus Aenigmatarchaeota archaeon]
MRLTFFTVPIALIILSSMVYAATISLNFPTSNTQLNGTVLLNATVDVARSNASFYYNETYIGTNYSTGTEFTLVWNSSTIPDGVYSFKVNVSNGDQVTSDNVTVDNHPPQIEVELPANTTYGYSTSLPLNFSLSETGDWCGYSLDNGAIVTIPSCSNTTFNTTEGVHNITVSANDTLGNMNSSATRFFLVDLTSPSINSVSIDDNYVGDGDNFVVEVNSTDNLDTNLTVTEAIFNSTHTILTRVLDNYNGIYNTTNTGMNSSYAEGTYYINITSVDDAGNLAFNDSLQLTLDNTPPSITGSGPSGTLTSSSVTLTATTDENAECRYSQSDDAFANMSAFSATGGTSHSHGLSLSNGNYLFYFRCRDPAENEGPGNTSFTVSVSNPPGGGSSSYYPPVKIVWVENEPEEEETPKEEPQEEPKEEEVAQETYVEPAKKKTLSGPTGFFIRDPNALGIAIVVIGVAGWLYFRKFLHKRKAKV